jgi:hypothetical protein
MRKTARYKAPQSTVSDYDITKSMLKTIDKLKKESIKEDKVDHKQLSGSELRAEEDKFTDIVSPRVTFGKFMVYPNDNNVIWNGKFNNGIAWRMDKNNGVTINAEGVNMDDEEMELISKLQKYHEVWADEWSDKLRTEYNITL